MNKTVRLVSLVVVLVITFAAICAISVSAAEPADSAVQAESQDAEPAGESSDTVVSAKAIAAAVAIAVAAGVGALGMAKVISKSQEGIARQPEAEGKLRTNMMLGLVFIETAIIYALVVVILIIFVL